MRPRDGPVTLIRMNPPDQLTQLLISLALITPVAVAEFVCGLYLLFARNLAGRARVAGGALVIVAAAQVARCLGGAALFWQPLYLNNGVPYRLYGYYALNIAVGAVEAAALALVVHAALRPARAVQGPGEDWDV